MSRRFGRNQRRRAREEIARLEGERQVSDELVANLSKSDRMHRELAAVMMAKRNALADQLEFVKEVLGDGFVALQAGVREVGPHELDSMSECMQFHVEQGAGFRVSTQVDQARRAMHVMLRCGSTGQAAYVLTKTAIAALSRERLADLLVRQVAPMLVAEVVKALKR